MTAKKSISLRIGERERAAIERAKSFTYERTASKALLRLPEWADRWRRERDEAKQELEALRERVRKAVAA